MVEKTLHCLKEADSYAAIEFLNQQPEATAVAEAYNAVVKKLYWQEKNIAQVAAMSRAGIQYCFDQAEKAAASDMARFFELRSSGKQLAYNLASYTWPGWNEAGVEIAAQYVEEGLDAARLNLRLALELDKGDLPLSRAYWMLGAHLLAKSAVAGAEANFRRAEMYALRADAPADEMLNHAFASLAYWMREPDSYGYQLTYVKAWERLGVLKDGEALQGQLDNARSVFKV